MAELWISKKKKAWTPSYLQRLTRTLEADVFPYVGNRPMRSLTSSDFLTLVERVADRGSEVVAIDICKWCSAVFRYAILRHKADTDPLYALKGAITRPPVKHSKPLSREDLKQLFKALATYPCWPTTKLAIRLLLHTFVRTNELCQGTWQEVSFDSAVWSIPDKRMKMRRDFVVPLSRQVMEMLRELQALTGKSKAEDWLLPGALKDGKSMSRHTINRALSRMGINFTGHDCRATASTHLYEMGWPEDVVEVQLAHVEENKVKAAYNHAQYMSQRREMMQVWSDWLDAIEAEALKDAPPVKGALEATTV